MRQIGTIPDEQQARRFADYLLTRGIKVRVDADTDRSMIWVYDEDHLDEARQELEAFREAPNDPQYRQAATQAAELRKEEERQQKTLQKQHVDVRQQWDRPLTSRAPVTFALILVSVVVAFASQLGQQHEPVVNWLSIASYEVHGNSITYHYLSDIRHGQLWRLVTPIFLHFGILHIVFNMLWLRELGSAIEVRRGSWRFAAFVLMIAVSSNLAQYVQTGPSFGGMSGVVFGLFGYIWMKSKFEPESGLYMPPTLVFLMIGYFFLCLTGMVGNVANMAHGVGLAAGIVLGYLPTLWRQMTGE